MSFYFTDGKIWCRTYQIADDADTKKLEAAALHKGEELTQLVEIGPRFVLTPIRIFDGSFGGQTLYRNEKYISPNTVRHNANANKHNKYVSRKKSQRKKQIRDSNNVIKPSALDSVFHATDE